MRRQFTAHENAERDRLINERCTCGHARLLHTDTCGGLAKGHGFCAVGTCDCHKFTWTPNR